MQSGGDYHIIVCYPYDITSWACYDKVGDLRQLDVLDVEIEESLVAKDIEEMFGDDDGYVESSPLLLKASIVSFLIISLLVEKAATVCLLITNNFTNDCV